MAATWAVLRPSGTIYSLHRTHREAVNAAAHYQRIQGRPAKVVLWA